MQARVYTSMNNAHTNATKKTHNKKKKGNFLLFFFRERKYKIIHSFSAAQFH